jgi:hypothetical protein
MSTQPFVTDVKALRERARRHIERGAVTEGYQADCETVIKTRLLLGKRRRRRGERRQLKAQVQTWEDEGGHVPDVQTVSPNRGAA